MADAPAVRPTLERLPPVITWLEKIDGGLRVYWRGVPGGTGYKLESLRRDTWETARERMMDCNAAGENYIDIRGDYPNLLKLTVLDTNEVVTQNVTLA